MAVTTTDGSTATGGSFQEILDADDLQPGDVPSYQICKAIYLYHPLGARVAENPVTMAQSQQRGIKVRLAPSDDIKNEFIDIWNKLRCDNIIHYAKTISRVYGISTLSLLAEGIAPDQPIDYKNIRKLRIGFNVYDPLNTSGSLTMDQDPNSIRFQKPIEEGVSVAGTHYHPSRSIITLNEQPIYIAWTSSAFGYVGRSAYQRALYPLKSYINTLKMDDMVTRKAGVIIAKMKPAGSIVNNIMAAMNGVKRMLLREAKIDNVISISTEEEIESLNLQNLEGPAAMARQNILENIASAADMPAKLLNSLPFTDGFGEGKEDAKAIAKYIDGIRDSMMPLYVFMDKIVMYLAWTPEFFEIQKKKFPEEYKNVPFTTAFYDWVNSFEAIWPSLLVEPESEKVKVADTKLKAIIALIQVLAPMIDPENRMELVKWAVDAITEDAKMFTSTPDFDYEEMAKYEPPEPLAIASGKQGVTGAESPEPEKGIQSKPGRAKHKLSTADTVSLVTNLVALKRDGYNVQDILNRN